MTLSILNAVDHLAVVLAGIASLTALVIWGGLSVDVAVPVIASLSGVSSATSIVSAVKGNGSQAPPSGGSPTMGA